MREEKYMGKRKSVRTKRKRAREKEWEKEKALFSSSPRKSESRAGKGISKGPRILTEKTDRKKEPFALLPRYTNALSELSRFRSNTERARFDRCVSTGGGIVV